MKTRIFVLFLVCLFTAGIKSISAQSPTHDMSGHKMSTTQNNNPVKSSMVISDSVKVMGNCGSCKTRIEKAARSVSGVKSASWNEDTKMLHLTFTGEIKTVEVQKAVAKVGHDTGPYKATKEAYNALPACCQYRE